MIKEKSKKLNKGTIISCDQIADKTYYIEFEAEDCIESQAGQYISILCGDLTLRRPFSIASHQGKKIGILFKEKGEGTAYIKNLKPSDSIDFMGPLGNGFKISKQKSLLIGAGVGAAPVFYLRNKLIEKKAENLFAAGFTNADNFPGIIKCDKIITDDGSLGLKGTVLDYLEKIIFDFKPEIIYACGPEPVLKGVSQTGLKYNIETQIAVEKVMACSIGVCRGCAVKIKRNNIIQNATVCKDGPVFKGSEFVWKK